MNLSPSLLAIRAIAAELANRIFKPVAIITALSSFIVISLMVWAISVSAWWWLLAAPLFMGMIVVAVLLVLTGVVIRLVSPRPTRSQKKRVSDFVDKVQRLSEVTQTPKLFILFRAIKDIVAPSKTGYVQGMISDTKSLGNDFKEVLSTFSER